MHTSALTGLGPRMQLHDVDGMHREIFGMHGEVLNAVPVALAVLNEFWQVLFTNSQFNELMRLDDPASVLGRRLGEVCGCVNSRESLSGCGTSRACPECSVFRAIYLAGLKVGLCVALALPLVGNMRVSVGWCGPVDNLLRICAFSPA